MSIQTALHASNTDPVFDFINNELKRQQVQIELIASENIVSSAVLAAQGSVLTNKYAEGYPGRRYYGGCKEVDGVETIAIDRAKQLFGCAYANVQPHSGAQANGAVFLALLNPGDTYLAMSLEHGGHLSHGASVNVSGKWFKPVHYNVSQSTQQIEMEQVKLLAELHRPKVIIAGGSAYPRQIDFAGFRSIADSVNAIFMVDMAHFAGLVAGGQYPSPFPHAHVVTSTTHKTLRGPRGGIILTNDETLSKKFNSAVFPGTQGGPLMHVIAAKAVAFGEALQPSFRAYAAHVVENAKVLAVSLQQQGLRIVTGGTDSHVVLVDLSPLGITGKVAEAALEEAGLTCNKNAIPFDKEKPAITSGIRLGSAACTTRGFGKQEFEKIGQLIGQVLHANKHQDEQERAIVQRHVSEAVSELCKRFPIYTQPTV
jgi:glycine hydroxymethyltransferase